MGLFSSIIKIGGGLVGGLVGGPAGAAIGSQLGGAVGGAVDADRERSAANKQIGAMNKYNSPAEIRKRAEAAGFNPLLFVGPGVGQQTALAGTSYFGAENADQQNIWLDMQMADREVIKKNQTLEEQNQKLKETLRDTLLRPKVPGIYGDTPANADSVHAAQKVQLGGETSGSGVIGPRALVSVQDALSGKWMSLDPRVADRLGLNSGDVFMASDYENVLGDVAGEALTNVAAFEGAVTGKGVLRNMAGPMAPPAKQGGKLDPVTARKQAYSR